MMNQYMLLLYADEQVGMSFPKEEMDKAIATMNAYADTLRKADALISHGALGPTTKARTLTSADSELRVHNGPYAETQEQLGGYIMIRAASMEEAQKWAAKCPASSWGHIEIREVQSG
jgi:hypothetical protein